MGAEARRVLNPMTRDFGRSYPSRSDAIDAALSGGKGNAQAVAPTAPTAPAAWA